MTHSDELIDERIRAAVPRHDNPNWPDVRRRARRKSTPVAVAAILIVAILVAAPAFAFRSQLDDLWSTAEPEKGVFVQAVADCGVGPFTLEFDPERSAVVRQLGKPLAHASLTEREIDCRAPIRSLKVTPAESPWHGLLDSRSYGTATVSCAVEGPLRIVVNPIWLDVAGESPIVGSTLLVAERHTSRSIASAVFKREPGDARNWSRTYWDSRVCSAQP